ncbi:hypothetical protein F511_29972 [Dorcoceras hygrometricum]|uniref:Uncharacterized protein n=1 Tax=Dorcoceras hygrometricum TaxID=472368 RepID=A0A2Z7CQY5_9LAMI|nr:hypothetical protein F511_29972 [Dorcoceras hygrometricum]
MLRLVISSVSLRWILCLLVCKSSLRLLFLRLDFLRLDMQNTVACDWVHCSLRLVHHLATGILCDWYLATGILRLVPCDWYLATAGYQRKEHLLNLSAKSKRCRINLFKRHHFAIANFNSCASCRLLNVMTSLLMSSSLIPYFSSQLDPDFYSTSSSSNFSPAFSEYHSCWSKLASADIILLSLTSSINYWLHCSSLLIADVTADFIIADPALALLVDC